MDQGTAAFRRLLGEASAGEQARVDALVAFSQRSVFAATWPGQNQAVRTLTNREGETAMPLFTGFDLLEETATRFGWRNPDGSLPMRELNAREALRHALARGVHFVVVDIGCEHSVEFTREEVEPLLALQSQGGSGPFAAKGEPEAAIRDAVRRSSRPPSMAAMNAVRAGKPEIDMPFAELKQRGISQPVSTPGRPASQPMAAVNATRLEGAPLRPASQPMVVVNATRLEAPQRSPSQGMPVVRPASVPMMQSVQPPAAAAPAPAPARAAYVLPPSDRPPLAPEPATRAGALEVAAALASAAKAAGDPEAVKAAEEMAKMLLQNAVASEQVGDKRGDAAASAGKKMAAMFMGGAMPDAAAERESGEQEKATPVELPDTLLQAISAGLRSFPEVEWACVLTDGSDLPVIGVRVDPSFLNRVAQISDGIVGIGDKQGQELQVLLLNTPDLMKSARKEGKAFYPWKR